MPAEFSIKQDDITRVGSDLLLLKFARGFHGADMAIANMLCAAGICAEKDIRPRPDDFVILDTKKVIARPGFWYPKNEVAHQRWPALCYSSATDMTESKYIEKKSYRSRYAPERVEPHIEQGVTHDDLLASKDELPKFVPFLARKCGVGFFGRILEIGAGGAWLSAELSRLPNVVEVIATDFSPTLLKEHAPKVFQSLKANPAKITRTPGDFHKLDFPDNYFDFVVCSAALHQAVNMVQVLREVKRVLKSGGQFVAIREPVRPRVKFKSGSKTAPTSGGHGYSLTHYKELFKQAALPLLIKRVNLSDGFKYYVNEVVNGLTHARYAFIGRKHGSPAVATAGAAGRNASRLRWLLSGPRPHRTLRSRPANLSRRKP